MTKITGRPTLVVSGAFYAYEGDRLSHSLSALAEEIWAPVPQDIAPLADDATMVMLRYES